MKKRGKQKILLGLIFIFLFIAFTLLLLNCDVKPLGINGSNIGFSRLNLALHRTFGVNMTLYTVTDWAGLVPIFVAFSFGILGLFQLIKRKRLLLVDSDILILGAHYIIVAAFYIIFEALTINFRPILINGFMEGSYPSSTTLLVLSVMPTLSDQLSRRLKASMLKNIAITLVSVFSVFMVTARLFSGVHWFTDIFGSVLISVGLFYIYKGFVLIFSKNI